MSPSDREEEILFRHQEVEEDLKHWPKIGRAAHRDRAYLMSIIKALRAENTRLKERLNELEEENE